MPDRRALAASLFERDVRPKPPADEMTPPIAWMLGPEMIGALKSFLLYASYKGELDPHDWMHAEPIAYEAEPGAREFWFDFVSDIGDGQRAMYTTAAVIQDDVFVEGTLDELIARREGTVALPAVAARPDGWSTLPRGRVLVCGGDTAYPLADRTNLEEHVRLPFTWAYRDLVAAGRLTDDDGRPLAPHDLVGIPGNHDYYNELSGFNRMFRAPITSDDDDKRPPLGLLGFERRQGASYFSLDFPFGWQLWGMDPGEHGLDTRQHLFFRARPRADKLVLLTPGPPVAFGRVLIERPLAGALAGLGLAQPYLDRAPVMHDGKPPDAAWPRELAPGTCRVDIAGDMHHYGRFASAPSYAAVVSGAGGAFHHPTFTDFGEVAAQAHFPPPRASRAAIAEALFHPRTIFNGGVVNVATFVLALVVCAGSIRADTRVVTDWLLGLLGVRGEHTWFSDEPAHAWYGAPWSALRGAALFAGSIAIAGALVLAALAYARWVTRTIRKPRAEWPWAMRALRALPFDRVLDERGYLPSWLLVIAALALPALTGQLVALPGGAAELLFQLLFLSVLAVIVVAMLALAVIGGGEVARPAERARWWTLGAIHAAIQLSTPLVIVRVGLGHPIGLAFALAVAIGFGGVSRLVLARGHRFGPILLTALWIGHWLLMIAFIVDAGDGVAVRPDSDGGWVLFLLAAGAVGSIVGCIEYGWYLAVASSWNGHNNEAGAAARIERFRQFVRFRVEPDRLTGFVIAIEETATELTALRPRVVDVFTISPR